MDKYIATISCDRSVRIYSTENIKYRCLHNVNKMAASDQVRRELHPRMI